MMRIIYTNLLTLIPELDKFSLRTILLNFYVPSGLGGGAEGRAGHLLLRSPYATLTLTGAQWSATYWGFPGPTLALLGY